MRSPKILMIGSDQVWSLERIYRKHLLELGIEVELFAAQNYFYDYYGASLVNKIIYRAGISRIYGKINRLIEEKVTSFQPDLIWVFKGMEILPQTLQKLAKKGIKLVNYNPDNPFLFSGSGSGNKNVSDSIGLYHVHLSYDHDISNRITSEFNIPCFILPFGFELGKELYEDCSRQSEVNKLCFLGNPDKFRVSILEQLAQHLPLDVYGNDWNKFTNHPGISIHPPVYSEGFWKTLSSYRVQLNLLRPHNPASHNMRSFEIPGVGGLGLFPNTKDHKEYLYDFDMIKMYGSADECVTEARSMMSMTQQEVGKWRMSNRQLSLDNGYDYMSRTRQFLNFTSGAI